jgi:hypothetical protein
MNRTCGAILWPYRTAVFPCMGTPLHEYTACCANRLNYLTAQHVGWAAKPNINSLLAQLR